MKRIMRCYNGGWNKPLYQRLFEVYQSKGYVPTVTDEESLPLVYRKPDELLLKFDWTETPFDKDEPLKVPYFDLYTGEYLEQAVELDHSVFNVPLRRDLVKRSFEYYQKYDMKFVKGSLTQSEIAGSNKKPHPQKGLGKARQGHRRAPGRMGGVKVHGRKKKMHRIDLPRKVRLQAFKTILTAKLADGRIRITNNEDLEDPYTRDVVPILELFEPNTYVNVVVSSEPCENFMLAQRNVKNIQVFKANEFTLYDIMKGEKTLITLQALEELNKSIMEETISYNCPKSFDLTQLDSFREKKQAEEAEETVYDPSRPLKLRFPLLQQYLEDYEEDRRTKVTEEN